MTHGRMSGQVTQRQIDQLMAMTGGAARKVLELMVKHGEIDHDGIQRVLTTNSTEYKWAMKRTIEEALLRLQTEQRFVDEEVTTTRGYPHDHRLLDIEAQIEVLCQHWPAISPDAAIRYARDVWPTFQTPDWVEGPFALICPGFFSDRYDKEVGEVLRVLAKIYYRRFNDQLPDGRTSKHLRQCVPNGLHTLMRQQPNSDILIVGGQFGLHHRGRSVPRTRVMMASDEFGFGVKDVATMLLTHLYRLNGNDHLWVECPGDEYSPRADDIFEDSIGFAHNLDYLRLVVSTTQRYSASGSATGFLPPTA